VKTRCQHFALLLGQRARVSHLGLPGQLARHSPTVRDAIRTFAVYQHLNTEGAAISLLEAAEIAKEAAGSNPYQIATGLIVHSPRKKEISPGVAPFFRRVPSRPRQCS
jgi:hypothetical protein